VWKASFGRFEPIARSANFGYAVALLARIGLDG